MDIKTDPAGRLLDILELAREQPESNRTRDVLGVVFNIESIDTESLLRVLADLILLSQQTKAKIKSLDDISHEIYLKPFANIEKIFSTFNLDASWKPYRDLLREPTLYGLKFCSDKLSRIEKNKTIESSEIASIQADLNELVEAILKAEIEMPLKELLLRNLEAIRQSLISYRVRGLEGIEREVEAGVGAILINKNMIKRGSSDSNTGSLLKTYFSMLDTINKTVTAAKNIKESGAVGLFTGFIEMFKQ